MSRSPLVVDRGGAIWIIGGELDFPHNSRGKPDLS